MRHIPSPRALKTSQTLAAAMLFLLSTGSVVADESLLWKSIGNAPAVVVPAYAGQPSPFPIALLPTKEVSDTGVQEEQRRLREAALQSAQALLANGKGLRVDLRPLRVDGKVEGLKGPRVLITNVWIGTGQKLQVRAYKSYAALDAIKTLGEYDTSAAAELTSRLDAQLAANPVQTLTLSAINKDTLVFTGANGPYEVKYSVSSNN